jgi:hypothetical protein
VRVRSHGERVRERVALFDEDLVANASAGGIEVYAMRPCEGLDGRVLLEVLRRSVLDVMVKREYRLTGIMYIGRADGLEPAFVSLRDCDEEGIVRTLR